MCDEVLQKQRAQAQNTRHSVLLRLHVKRSSTEHTRMWRTYEWRMFQNLSVSLLIVLQFGTIRKLWHTA